MRGCPRGINWGALTRWDRASSDMVGRRRGEQAHRATWRGFDAEGWRVGRDGEGATGWDGARAGQRGSLYFWHP